MTGYHTVHSKEEFIALKSKMGGLVGIAQVDYKHIVDTFGEPCPIADSNWWGDRKIDVEWIIVFDDGKVATIYNYKDGPAYGGPIQTPVALIQDWHFGGDKEALIRVLTLLDMPLEFQD